MTFLRRLLPIAAIMAMPVTGYAQEAVLTGTITDSTGGVLPGVTVSALLEATGNRFEAVTDERGIYRMPVRVGGFQITAELAGFSTASRPGVQLLLGQTVTVNLQMAPSTLQETVTVTGEAPLLSVATSSLGGNIDPQQVQEMPVEGRNWMALLLLAPGSRTTSTTGESPLPARNGGEVREYQTNVDGQQVTNTMGGGGQPTFSQEMIGELQFISNRFDATQGRSQGVQVNLVTKSGTNRFAGTFRGNFRDSRLNAANPVLGTVQKLKNQQFASTFGGPIRRDKLHFFAYHEYEREPKEETWNTPFPRFNVTLEGASSVKHGGLRLDYQVSPATRLMVKGDKNTQFQPFGAGNNQHPAATSTTYVNNDGLSVQLTNVLSNRTLNEVTVGYSSYLFGNENLTTWSRHWMAQGGPFGQVTTGSPRIQLTGFNITGNAAYPRHRVQNLYNVKDNLTFSYDAGGRHDLKLGGEFLFHQHYTHNCTQCMGAIDARNGPIPANVEDIFPDAFNADTWNLAALSSITRRYTLGIHLSRRTPVRIPNYSAWAQNDWHATNKLTLNLGIRYDLLWNAFSNDEEFLPFMEKGRAQELNNIQPRVGFAYQVNDRTVLRGGVGKYYAEIIQTTFPAETKTVALIEVANDGRPDFAANPFNGPPPTFEQALTRFCSAPQQAANFAAWQARAFSGTAPCLLRGAGEMMPPEGAYHMPHTWQSTVGFQRQLGPVTAVEADYVFSRGRNEKWIQGNVNLDYNPTTGANTPYVSTGAGRALLPYPQFGIVAMTPFMGKSAYHALQTALTRRMSNNWQASATYTLSGLWTGVGAPLRGVTGATPVLATSTLAPDLAGEWGFDSSDQRHRMVFNGIWQVGHGFQISGIHYTGIGQRAQTSYGGDLRLVGAGGSEAARLRPDGTIVPRNGFTQPPRHRTSLRLQQRISLPRRVSVDAMLEAFNLFNRPNWTITTQESSPQYLQRTSGENRTMQFGFRVTF
jgi:hypothetical protein